MGSGKYLWNAIKKYGIENFKKGILFQLDNVEDMYKKEAEIVNEEFIARKDTYNIKLGGNGGWDHLKGTILVKDKNGNKFRIPKNDPRYLSGELKSALEKICVVRDNKGNLFHAKITDEKYISGEWKCNLIGQYSSKGKFTAKDKTGQMFQTSINDPRFLSGKLVGNRKGMIRVKDKDNNIFWIHRDDEKVKSGEVTRISKRKMTKV